MTSFWIPTSNSCMLRSDSFRSSDWNAIFSCSCQHTISACLRKIAVVPAKMQTADVRKIHAICLSGLISRWKNFSHPDAMVRIQAVGNLIATTVAVSVRHTAADVHKRAELSKPISKAGEISPAFSLEFEEPIAKMAFK